MPLPLLPLLGTVPWWAWLSAATATAGTPLFQRGWKKGQEMRPPSAEASWLTPWAQAQRARPEYGELEAYRKAVSQYGVAGAGEPPIFAPPKPEDGGGGEGAIDHYETKFDPFSRLWTRIEYDKDNNIINIVDLGGAPWPGGIDPYQQAQLAQQGAGRGLERERLSWEQQQWGQQLAWYKQQAEMQAQVERERISAESQARREEQLASLRAQPASWLQYSLLAGETPGVQPWMQPLMPQQYQGVQAGAAIPNWQAPQVAESQDEFTKRLGLHSWGELMGYGEGGEEAPGYVNPMEYYTGLTPQAAPDPRNMPALTTPSTQYLARMGPTSLAQYGGYEQARTGIPPENLQWRLQSQAPPGGQYGRLRWAR